MIKGTLEGWSETGTEGMVWCVEEDGKEGYNALNPLRDGDHLRILSDDILIWEGVIDLEYETGYRPYPMNPEYGQQCACGFWVRGNQKGFEIENWAKLFLSKPPLRAELVRIS